MAAPSVPKFRLLPSSFVTADPALYPKTSFPRRIVP
jgi:hypothetical protein